jgi:Tfp pilus assembly PilM family ATPase
MRLLSTKPYLNNEQLKSKMQEQTELNSYINWQIIYSVQINFGAKMELISSMLGISIYKIYRIIQAYNKNGTERIGTKERNGEADVKNAA